MRNVARRGVFTQYMLVIDVDILPSFGINDGFRNLLSSLVDNNTVYIVPAFEMATDSNVPEKKGELLELLKIGRARPFYEELCSKCHACVHYPKWIQFPSPNESRCGLLHWYELLTE